MKLNKRLPIICLGAENVNFETECCWVAQFQWGKHFAGVSKAYRLKKCDGKKQVWRLNGTEQLRWVWNGATFGYLLRGLNFAKIAKLAKLHLWNGK